MASKDSASMDSSYRNRTGKQEHRPSTQHGRSVSSKVRPKSTKHQDTKKSKSKSTLSYSSKRNIEETDGNHSDVNHSERENSNENTDIRSQDKSVDGKDDNLTPKDMVISVMKSLISDLRSSSNLFSRFIQEFNPEHPKFGFMILEECSPSVEEAEEASYMEEWESGGKSNRESQKSAIYDVRILMTRPQQPGTFELTNGMKYGIPSGHAALSVSSAFTCEERHDKRREWLPCLDDMTLCPRKIHSWISAGVKHGLKKLKGKEMHGKKLNFMVSTEFPTITIILTAVAKETEDTQVITMNLMVAIEMSTLPGSATIQHPFPRQMPYSIEGQQVAQKLSDEIHDGRLTYIVEIPKETAKDSPKSTRAVKSAPPGGRNKKQVDKPPPKAYWKLNMATVTKRMMKISMKSDTLKHARDIPNIFQKIQTEKGAIWLTVSSEVISCVMLWTIKKRAGVAETKKDWFLYFCHNLQAAMAHKYCPDFFLSLCNILDGKDPALLEKMDAELCKYLKDVDRDRRTQEILLGED